MTPLPDTGPQTDGTRTPEQWYNAMAEDAGVVARQVASTLPDVAFPTGNKPLALALARKEARRLVRDIERYAEEVHGITRDELDRQGPL